MSDHCPHMTADRCTVCLELAAAKVEVTRLRTALSKQNEEISQTLGAVLGYPRFCDDQANFPGATAADGVCVGEHVAETLALEVVHEIDQLRRRVEKAEDMAIQDVRQIATGWGWRPPVAADDLRHRAEKAESAAAEMRAALEQYADHDFYWCGCGRAGCHTDTAAIRDSGKCAKAALSTDAGRGWLYPERAAAMAAVVRQCEEALTEALTVVDTAYSVTGFVRAHKTSHQRIRIEGAIAAAKTVTK